MKYFRFEYCCFYISLIFLFFSILNPDLITNSRYTHTQTFGGMIIFYIILVIVTLFFGYSSFQKFISDLKYAKGNTHRLKDIRVKIDNKNITSFLIKGKGLCQIRGEVEKNQKTPVAVSSQIKDDDGLVYAIDDFCWPDYSSKEFFEINIDRGKEWILTFSLFESKNFPPLKENYEVSLSFSLILFGNEATVSEPYASEEIASQ